MKLFKQFTSVALAVILTAGMSAGSLAEEATESPASSDDNTVKLGLMIARNGQSLSSDEWEILADIFEDVINNKHDDLSLPFAADEGLPALGGAKVEFVTGEQIDTQTAVMVADQLIQEEGVVGLFGHFTSTTTAAAMVSAEKNSVPLLSEGTSMSLLNAGYDYWLRSFGGDDFYVESSMEFIDSVNAAHFVEEFAERNVSAAARVWRVFFEQKRGVAVFEFGKPVLGDIHFEAAAHNLFVRQRIALQNDRILPKNKVNLAKNIHLVRNHRHIFSISDKSRKCKILFEINAKEKRITKRADVKNIGKCKNMRRQGYGKNSL